MSKTIWRFTKSLAISITSTGIVLYGVFTKTPWALNLIPFLMIVYFLLYLAGWIGLIYASTDSTVLKQKDRTDLFEEWKFLKRFSILSTFFGVLSVLITFLLASQGYYLSAGFSFASNCFNFLFRKSMDEFAQKYNKENLNNATY